MMRVLLNKFAGRAFCCVCLMLAASHGFADKPLSDSELLRSGHDTSVVEQDGSGVSFMDAGSDRFLSRVNPVRLSLGGMMYVYQRFVSPQLPSECLYHPTCSGFSKELIRDLGLIKGVAATADRLSRCNRVAAFDIHPMHIHEDSGKAVEDTGIYTKSAYD